MDTGNPAQREPTLRSDALRVNLRRTSVGVQIPEAHRVLLDVVADWTSLQERTEEMLREIHHRFVGWPQALDDLHRRAMGDFARYDGHLRGAEGIAVFCELYAKVAVEAPPPVRADAARQWLYYLTRVAAESSDDTLSRNLEPVGAAVGRFGEVLGVTPDLLAEMSPYLRRFAATLQHRGVVGAPLDDALRLLAASLEDVYVAFGGGDDPAEWLAGLGRAGEPPEAFAAITHERLARLLAQVRGLDGTSDAEALLALPDTGDLARAHIDAARDLARAAEGAAGRLDELHWLLEMVGRPHLAGVHEVALRQLTRCWSALMAEGEPGARADVAREVFVLLRRAMSQFPLTVQGLIEQIGRDAMASGDGGLAEVVVGEILATDFQYPEFGGFTPEWDVRVNPGHLGSIRTYLRVIEADPVRARPLLAGLVVHLRLGGVFISDTDLFQKDISSLLGSDVSPVYLYAKELLRLFPAYHNEIGAEGVLRDVSTRLDELEGRRDHLFHFLRKQCHVECNSEMVPFTEEIIRFCAFGDPEPLRGYLPEALFAELQAEPGREPLRTVFDRLSERGVPVEELLSTTTDAVTSHLATLPGCDPTAVEEVDLLFRVRSEIADKYRLDGDDALQRLRAFRRIPRERVDRIEDDLQGGRYDDALDGLLGALESLREIIQRPGPVDAAEDIYRKRHIAVGIPSMYGSYHEERFEAMGLSLRLEAFATALAERAVEDSELLPLTDARMRRVARWLHLLMRALRVDGFRAQGLAHCASILDEAVESGVTDRQYLNVFWLASRNLESAIQARILAVYEQPARVIVGRMLDRGVVAGPAGASRDEAILAITEGLLRNVIAESFGLQRLDQLISRVLHAIDDQLRTAPQRRLTATPRRSPAPDIVRISDATETSAGVVALGNKGYMLRRMRGFGFHVPDGFVITTATVSDRLAGGPAPGPDTETAARVAAELHLLEERTGRRLGDPRKPLLLSVRGGAPISMPGMLETFLNVGLSLQIAEQVATNPDRSWSAWDAHRRLAQFWGMSHGLGRDLFEDVIAGAKRRHGASKKAQLRPEWMREVALGYRAVLDEHRVPLIEDPFEQLLTCIVLVARSWDSEVARIYREEVGIAHEWSTAVIVQEMVFGNLGPRSGSGVVLTRHPVYEGQGVELYGDFVVQAQGEDVVAGLVETVPVSNAQAHEMPTEPPATLERDFPEIYAGILEMAQTLVIDRGMNHQEIEFTFEGERSEDLFVLQTRDAVTSAPGVVSAFVRSPELDAARIAAGIGVGGGAMSGRVAHSQQELDELAARYPGERRILLRRDTVPDDIRLILQVDGLVTAIGGATSHAAVAAKRLGKACVVGCRSSASAVTERRPEWTAGTSAPAT